MLRPIPPVEDEALELISGDRMSREEFHRAYKQTPPGFKAELIGGIVYVASPLKMSHGVPHASLTAVLVTYSAATPGTLCADNATVLLGHDAEPQPDLHLRILPEYGGQSRVSDDDYVSGAPEFIAEVALSSRALDLHAKKHDYLQNGVREYLVVSIADKRLHWFDLREDRELFPETDGVYRINTFPGLWVDSIALLAGDNARLLATLQRGLASPEHAAFIAALAAGRKS